jgi:hypothetical protein
MRIIRMAVVGTMAFCFLLSAPAIAAKAIVLPYPGPIVQTYQQTRSVAFYATTGGGGDPNEEVPAYMGEGLLASLIGISAVFQLTARKKRLEDRRLLYSQLQSALKDFREGSLTVKLNQAKGYEIRDDTWRDLNAAKARVDATADAVLDIVSRPGTSALLGSRTQNQERGLAELAKEETSHILKALENPPDPAALAS